MKARITILPTCPCVDVQKSVELPPRGGKTVTITFDPDNLPGPVNVFLVFLTDDEGSKGYFFRVFGSVSATEIKR
jgi:hypothetical protein